MTPVTDSRGDSEPGRSVQPLQCQWPSQATLLVRVPPPPPRTSCYQYPLAHGVA